MFNDIPRPETLRIRSGVLLECALVDHALTTAGVRGVGRGRGGSYQDGRERGSRQWWTRVSPVPLQRCPVRALTNLDFMERECLMSDLVGLLAIEKKAGEGGWTRNELFHWFERTSARFRVIVVSGRPCVPIAFFVTLKNGQELYLANIAVAPDWRRRGVGRFALERVEVLDRRLGCARIALDVQERNLGAQLLYRAMGFLAVKIMHGHYGSQDGYRMQKELPPSDDNAGQPVQVSQLR